MKRDERRRYGLYNRDGFYNFSREDSLNVALIPGAKLMPRVRRIAGCNLAKIYSGGIIYGRL